MWQCSLYSVFAVQSIWTAHKGAFWRNVLLNLIELKFRYSEKAEKIWKKSSKYIWCILHETFFCILGKNNNNPNRWKKSNHKKVRNSAQNLYWKLGQQRAICWNSLGLFRDCGLNHIFFGINLFLFFKIESWNFQHLFEK